MEAETLKELFIKTFKAAGYELRIEYHNNENDSFGGEVKYTKDILRATHRHGILFKLLDRDSLVQIHVSDMQNRHRYGPPSEFSLANPDTGTVIIRAYLRSLANRFKADVDRRLKTVRRTFSTFKRILAEMAEHTQPLKKKEIDAEVEALFEKITALDDIDALIAKYTDTVKINLPAEN
jgi:hypothetical protein